MFELPTTVGNFGPLMPSRLVLASHQGCGKTTAVSLLPDCLVLDLESGTEGYGGMNFNLKKKMNEYNMQNPDKTINMVQAFYMFIDSLKKTNAAKKGYAYKFLAIDTLTKFQEMAETLATRNFNNSVIGKGMIKKGDGPLKDVVSELPEGGGYRWLFNAFEELYGQLNGLVEHGIIFLGHTKQGSLLKNDTLVPAKDLDLTGKLKTYLLRDCQASGHLTRKKAEDNKVIFSSSNIGGDLMVKGRSPHLSDVEFTFSELNKETGELTVYWNLIYPEWIKEPITKKIR